MIVAGYAGTLLFLTWLAHVILWRVRLPKSHTLTLLILFLGALPVALALNVILPAAIRIHGFWQHVQVSLFHVAMSLAYIEFYTSIEEDSPSMTLLLFVDQAGADGRSEDEMFELIDDNSVIGGRLQAMLRRGFVQCEDDVYQLTALGRAWARVFQLARQMYQLELGG